MYAPTARNGNEFFYTKHEYITRNMEGAKTIVRKNIHKDSTVPDIIALLKNFRPRKFG